MLRSLQPDFVFARFDTGIGIVGPPIDRMVTIERVALGLFPQRTDITWDEAERGRSRAAPTASRASSCGRSPNRAARRR